MRTGMTARRLCMVVHSSIPADPRVMAQVRAAREGGWEVDVVALREPAQPELETLDGDVQVHRLPVVHRRGSALGAVVEEYLSFTTRAAWKAGALHARRRYDVVEVHNPPDFLVLAALAPRLGVPRYCWTSTTSRRTCSTLASAGAVERPPRTRC